MLFVCCITFNNAVGLSPYFPRGAHNVLIPNVPGVRADLLKNITPLVEQSIAEGYYPGAVIFVAHHGHIIYRGVFGNRRVVPDIAPMRFNTIFDIASLTKVVATTPAVMQLIEQGKLDIDAPVANYWPAFANNGKQNITIRELLTHTSGLQPDISMDGQGESEALRQIEKIPVYQKPGTTFVYSDVNFIVLAYLIEVITGERFDVYVQHHIFKPLGMNHTFFLPSPRMRDRIAPTEIVNGELRWGQVHDQTAYAMGGVSGNAGLFSDASDLAIYSQWLLDNGRISHGVKRQVNYILGPLTILKMTTPQTAQNIIDQRGLGWDIDSSFSSRGVLFPNHSFGHTGWTGTSIWIDPMTQTWVIILTSRTHPQLSKNNQLIKDRRSITNIVAASLTDVSTNDLANTNAGELNRAYK